MSRIDYSKLRSLSAKEIISALIRDGFTLNGRQVVIDSTVTRMEEE